VDDFEKGNAARIGHPDRQAIPSGSRQRAHVESYGDLPIDARYDLRDRPIVERHLHPTEGTDAQLTASRQVLDVEAASELGFALG
jgi:hypothetical protein